MIRATFLKGIWGGGGLWMEEIGNPVSGWNEKKRLGDLPKTADETASGSKFSVCPVDYAVSWSSAIHSGHVDPPWNKRNDRISFPGCDDLIWPSADGWQTPTINHSPSLASQTCCADFDDKMQREETAIGHNQSRVGAKNGAPGPRSGWRLIQSSTVNMGRRHSKAGRENLHSSSQITSSKKSMKDAWKCRKKIAAVLQGLEVRRQLWNCRRKSLTSGRFLSSRNRHSESEILSRIWRVPLPVCSAPSPPRVESPLYVGAHLACCLSSNLQPQTASSFDIWHRADLFV